MGGRAAANEVITEGLAGDVLAEHAFVQETAMLEEAWKRISTNGAVAYGKDMIVKALEEGAIETCRCFAGRRLEFHHIITI